MMNASGMIGRPERFGIAWKLCTSVPGFACLALWIGGRRLGRADEPTSIFSLANALSGMLEVTDPKVAQLLFMPVDLCWDRLETSAAKFRMPPIELLDDYDMYCLSDGSDVRYVWRTCGEAERREYRVTRSEVLDAVAILRALEDESRRRSGV